MAAEAVDRETGEIEPQEPADFPDVRLDRRFVVKRDGKDVVLYAGLLDLLHQLSGGFFDISTVLVQVPAPDNDQTAICTARVVVFDPDSADTVRRVASGIGDASPGNVTRPMAPHLIRMAETRAKARALRDCVNVGMVSLEELGEDEAPRSAAVARAAVPPRAADTPVRDVGPEGIVIEGKRYSRQQIEGAWRTRRAEAERLGIALPGDVATLVAEQAPLNILVGATQQLKRLVEATQAGQR